MQKKKILFLHSYLGVGGAEVLRLTILKHFDLKKYDPVVCSLSSKGEIGKEIEKLSIKIIALNDPWHIYSIRTLFSVIKIIKKEKPELIQCCMFNACFYGILGAILSRSKARIIAEEHCPETFKKWWHKLIDRILFKRADRIVCCSKYVCEYTAKNEKIPIKKFTHIPNCIDPEKFEKKYNKNKVKKELNISRNKKIIGVIGRLHKQKGQIYALKILQKILRKRKDVLLLLIGEGPDEKKLKNFTKKNNLSNNVIFLPNRKEIAKYYSIIDLLLVPSIQEGFGIVIIEAMYCDIPVIASNTGGIPEIIQNNKTGILVDIKNSKSVANKIIELLNNKNKIKRITAKAGKKILKKFLPMNYVKKLEKRYCFC